MSLLEAVIAVIGLGLIAEGVLVARSWREDVLVQQELAIEDVVRAEALQARAAREFDAAAQLRFEAEEAREDARALLQEAMRA